MKHFNLKFIFSALALFVASAFYFLPAEAQQNRSYNYDLIDVAIKVNEDSTLDVTERQTFNFVGEYHEAWRTIPFNKISGVSDIEVYDGETGRQLGYVGKKQNKLEPSSWGKYTYNNENGAKNIIWYYNQADTSHDWVLKYKIHGAVRFGSEADRLYWNIFTDYTVPINEVRVKVELPQSVEKSQVKYYSYRASKLPVSSAIENGAITYRAENFAPKEAFTIDLDFPKEMASLGLFWLDFAKIYYGYIGAILLALICLLIGFVYWYKTEGSKTGRGTIIPQYGPPQNLRPAMAEVITKESIGNKGLVATIVDLAVRGYVKIEEEPVKYFGEIKEVMQKRKTSFIVSLFVMTLLLIITFFALGKDRPLIIMPVAFLVFGLILVSRASGNDYVVRSVRPYKNESSLEKYEKAYLNLLLVEGGIFSTKALRKASNTNKRQFSEELKKLKELICEETEIDTNSFERSLNKEKYFSYFLTVVIIFFTIILQVNAFSFFSNQLFVLIVGLIISVGGLIMYVLFEARLSQQGRVLKEEWLGFKLYLEVAERYRLQNLTPDLFEKYLPYAIVFGVEKKWAKAFEGVNMTEPNWYAGNSYYSGGSGSASGFSPTGFSAGFTSAFTSAFASSGASGGAGGGSAGGGGGGGGGGAS